MIDDGELDGRELEAGDSDVGDPEAGDRLTLGAPDLAAALEALLIIADQPLGIDELAAVTGVPSATVAAEVQRLSVEYTDSGRGFDLREVNGGWRF